MEQIKHTKRVINLTNVEDITAYDYSEWVSTGFKWINYGKNNDYPSFLRTLYLSSPTHQAVIDGTINLATGEGIFVTDPVKNPISNKWVNENLPKDVVKSLIGDLKLYGYAVLQVYDGSIVKYDNAIKYRYDVRDDQGNINYAWVSKDWDNYTHRFNRPEKLPLYRQGSTEPLSILIAQLDKKGFQFYSPVDYNGSINYIATEVEISKYHLSNIKNGLFPSFLVNFIGAEFSEEQMDKIEMDINKKFGGSTNTGRAIVGFSASKDDATTLQTITQPNIVSQYDFLSKEASEKILLGHGVTSAILFGIKDNQGLGNNAQELEQAFYLYYESKLKHYQNYILEMIQKVMNGNLLYADVQFKTVNPFKNTTATQTLSKVDKVNEVDSQVTLNKIDSLKIITKDTLIGESIFNGKIKETSLYKFIKSSKETNIITKKLEILSNKGYLFKPDKDLIKNTKDCYWIEQNYMKKN